VEQIWSIHIPWESHHLPHLSGISDSIWSCCPEPFGEDMLAHPIRNALLLDICFLPLLAGVDVANGSFNGTVPDNCEGRTVTELQLYLV